MPETPSPRGERSRVEILRSAESLVADRGFSAVTIQEILDAAGVTKGKFFHHFRSKDHFFGELIRFALHDRPIPDFPALAAESPSPSPFDRIVYILDRMIDFHRRGLPEGMRLCVFATFFFSPASPEMKRISAALRSNMECLEQLLAQAQSEGELPRAVSPDLCALMLPSLTVGGNIIGYIHQRRRLSAENLESFKSILISLRQLPVR